MQECRRNENVQKGKVNIYDEEVEEKVNKIQT